MAPGTRYSAAFLGAPVTLAVALVLVAAYLLLGSERELATLFFAVHSSQLGEEGWFRIFTASAIHADPSHLSGNLIALLFLGILLEPRLGSARFTCVLLGAALSAALITTGLSSSPSVGASGAVYGLLGALLGASHVIARASGHPPPSLPLLAFVLGLVLLDNARTGIDHWAHAGGALGGAVLGVLTALLRGQQPSGGLRVTALVLACVYALAGVAGWAEYRLTETGAVVREWTALQEQAWSVATDVSASRSDLVRDRDRIRKVLSRGRGEQPSLLALLADLRITLTDTLATLHHRLGEHAEAIALERDLARDDDPFLLSQLARFQWAGLHAMPAEERLAGVRLERVDARIDRLELTLPEPRDASWSVDVLCSARGELVGLLRISAGVEVRTPVRVPTHATWPPSDVMLSPVHAETSVRGAADHEVHARYWPLHSEVKGLP